MSVNNKRVLITGASNGIGAAAAVAFAREGCSVGINYNCHTKHTPVRWKKPNE